MHPQQTFMGENYGLKEHLGFSLFFLAKICCPLKLTRVPSKLQRVFPTLA
jgi:hypothetical protein